MTIRKNTWEHLSIDESLENGIGTAVRELKAAGPTPEETCSLREIENIVLSLLPRIGLSSQPVMKLCLQLQLSPAEAARRLRLKLPTVKSRLSRGRKELRKALARRYSHRKGYAITFSQAA